MPTYEIDDKDDDEGDDELQTETHQDKSFDYSKGFHHPQKDGVTKNIQITTCALRNVR